MNSLNSLEAAEKIVYLTIQDFNEKWAGRKLRGFAEAHEALERKLRGFAEAHEALERKLRGFAEAHEALERMFEERYH